MARENDNNVEVIDPKDRRYKDDNYFFNNHFYFAFNYFYLFTQLDVLKK